MQKRRALTIRVLLGWWIFCLAGPCIALPLQHGFAAEPAGAPVSMQDARTDGRCAADETGCESEAFLPVLLLIFAGALPMLFGFGVPVRRFAAVLLPVVGPPGGGAPPIYRLSQRIRE